MSNRKQIRRPLTITVALLSVAAVLIWNVDPVLGQSTDGDLLDLRCERPSQYPQIFVNSEMEAACTDLQNKGSRYIRLAKAAALSPRPSSWLPSWLTSPQCKPEEFGALERGAVELLEAIDKALHKAKQILARADKLFKMAQEMDSTHNGRRAVEIGRQSAIYTDMAEDTMGLVPQFHLEYADSALAAQCYQQADRAYRFILEHFTRAADAPIRDRAKIGVDDVRAKQR